MASVLICEVSMSGDCLAFLSIQRKVLTDDHIVTSHKQSKFQQTCRNRSGAFVAVPRLRHVSVEVLHGWRRYVRREAQVTLIELNEETNEIRA